MILQAAKDFMDAICTIAIFAPHQRFQSMFPKSEQIITTISSKSPSAQIMDNPAMVCLK